MGLFKRLRANPKAEKLFNQSLDVYGHLRKYPEGSSNYHSQLRRIAAYLREAIGINQRHGDAHVLLANVYLLMFLDGYPHEGDIRPLQLAGAVIQHWADEPMKQYPWTKNRETAETLYSQIEDAVLAYLANQGTSPRSAMVNLKAAHYQGAVTKDMLE